MKSLSKVANTLILMTLLCTAGGALQAQAAENQAAPGAPVTEPKQRITHYSLSPEKLKKAQTLGRVRFASNLAGFALPLLGLWLVQRCGWAAKFRDFAEATSQRRPLQVLVFAPLLF